MKTRTVSVSALLFLSALYAPLAAAQANPWTKTQLAPTIYSAGTDNSNFFSPSGMLNSNTVNGVSWNIGLYSNGAASQDIKLCYKPPVGAEICLDNIARPTGNTTSFNGLGVKGTFRITYRLTGGNYPVTPTFSNTLTVGWQ
ncbi:MAG: hypothetical protein LBU43_06385 [Candidatus Accumulibacter sp.]|jgi:hypothetical protein|nr:hypothetical protein [Accumulibacter sp.]